MSGLMDMQKRLRTAGGNADGRNVKGKLKSMQAALWNSYQGEWITLEELPGVAKSQDKKYHWRCLINPEKLTTDYDQKQISIEHASGMKPGDVFFWNRTNKHWIVYNRFEQEEAYFRARIRKCDYQIKVGEHLYWIWLRGTVETALVWRQKQDLKLNDMNYSLEFYITDTPETRAELVRHKVLKFDNHNWKIATVDRYSQEGIIEVFLEEYFDNTMLDDMIVPEIIPPVVDPGEAAITGPQSVYVYDTGLKFSVSNAEGGTFTANSNKVKITTVNQTSCTVDILASKATSFELSYEVDGEAVATLPVTVKSF